MPADRIQYEAPRVARIEPAEAFSRILDALNAAEDRIRCWEAEAPVSGTGTLYIGGRGYWVEVFE